MGLRDLNKGDAHKLRNVIMTPHSLLIDARKQTVPDEAIAAFEKRRPDVDVVVTGPDAKGPPRARRK